MFLELIYSIEDYIQNKYLNTYSLSLIVSILCFELSRYVLPRMNINEFKEIYGALKATKIIIGNINFIVILIIIQYMNVCTNILPILFNDWVFTIHCFVVIAAIGFLVEHIKIKRKGIINIIPYFPLKNEYDIALFLINMINYLNVIIYIINSSNMDIPFITFYGAVMPTIIYLWQSILIVYRLVQCACLISNNE